MHFNDVSEDKRYDMKINDYSTREIRFYCEYTDIESHIVKSKERERDDFIIYYISSGWYDIHFRVIQ